MSASPRSRAFVVGVVLVAMLAALLALHLFLGSASARAHPEQTWSALRATLGLESDATPTARALLALRFWRVLTGAGVGAALAYGGALLQGLFRNPLASPSVLGITTGASVGAALAVCIASGFGPAVFASTTPATTWLVPTLSFAGAVGVGAVVHALASTRGRLSVPTLLLVGLAMNTFLGGALSLMQMLTLDFSNAARSIAAWGLGTLHDRGPWHAGVVWALAAPCFVLGALVAWELDLLQGGEEDARQLGVDVRRVRVLVIAAATLATAAAVAVAGQIAFVGLIVPHLVRLCGVRGHRALLALSPLAGAAFLTSADLAQSVAFADQLTPGVVMSLLGGPFFVWLLWRQRRELDLW